MRKKEREVREVNKGREGGNKKGRKENRSKVGEAEGKKMEDLKKSGRIQQEQMGNSDNYRYGISLYRSYTNYLSRPTRKFEGFLYSCLQSSVVIILNDGLFQPTVELESEKFQYSFYELHAITENGQLI